MSEQSEHHSDRRAEAAFREAFARGANAYDPSPLDLSVPSEPAPRRATWWWPAVAAVLVLVVSGALLLGRGDGTVGPPEIVDPAGAAEDAGDGPGAAEPGHAWVTWRDVAVQVPQEWAERDLAAEAGCGGDEASSDPAPYVARAGLPGIEFFVGCPSREPMRPQAFGPAPQELWAPHLSFSPAPPEPADGSRSYDGWTIVTRTLGDVQLRVWSRDADAGLSAQIAASARRVGTDQHGCPVESVVQLRGWSTPDPGTDLTGLREVAGAVVCHYLTSRPDTPGLYASHTLDAAQAGALVEALLARPRESGEQRSSCAPHDVLLVRLRHAGGVAELHAAAACLQGAVHDGTRSYDLTPEACVALARGPGTLAHGAFRPLATC